MAMSKENPFPGMNPYLETAWPDMHARLIVETCNVLGETLPADLTARAEEAVAIDGVPTDDGRSVRADAAVVQRESWRFGVPPAWKPGEHTGVGGVVAAEPEYFSVEDSLNRWVEIRTAGGEVVTIIEVISPSNRQGVGRGVYLRKQQACLASRTNLVEIDLIRAGPHVIAAPEERLMNRGGTHHFVCVRRRCDEVRGELYPCPLRERLPVIAIPLRSSDKDAVLDLQALINRCYRLGRYWQTDYGQALNPPLPPEEAAWAEERLRAAGLRK